MKKIEELAGYIASRFTEADIQILEHECYCITLSIESSKLLEFTKFLISDQKLLFDQLTDICGVDYLNRDPRFDVVYHWLSMRNNIRIRIKIGIAEGKSAPSLISIIKSSTWYEREIYDMYGIHFDGHDNLNRILMDNDFDGHPLRKDFPVSGNVEIGYDNDTQSLKNFPINLPYQSREFAFSTPWEGARKAVAKSRKIETS